MTYARAWGSHAGRSVFAIFRCTMAICSGVELKGGAVLLLVTELNRAR